MSGDQSVRLKERILDEKGDLLFEQPYPFRRLFKPGQQQIINSIHMTVISCEMEGDLVTTVVRCYMSVPPRI